jgi:hypothetical protein
MNNNKIQNNLETDDFTMGDTVKYLKMIDNFGKPIYKHAEVVGIYHGVGTIDIFDPEGLGNRSAHRPWDLEIFSKKGISNG